MLLKIQIRYKDAFSVTFKISQNLFNFYFLNIPTSRAPPLLHGSMGLACDCFCASYALCSGPKPRQHQITSSFQTIDLAYHDVPTQQASTTL